jgi:hypothetical protein
MMAVTSGCDERRKTAVLTAFEGQEPGRKPLWIRIAPPVSGSVDWIPLTGIRVKS